MSYTKITTSFKDHETVLTAAHLQHLEHGIADNDAALVNRVRTDTNAQGLGTSQKRNARTNIDAPSTAEMTAAVAAEADLRSAADAAMETKTDGIQDEVDQAKANITDLQAVSSSMVKTKTVAGNPITIKDALAGKVKKLVVHLEPKQNLNGYCKPWVGGTGKNLLKPFTNNPYTLNGITATLQNDGTYLTSGTATDTAELVFPTIDRDSSKSYFVSGSPAGGSTTTHRMIVRLYNGSSLLGTLTDSGSGLLVAPTEQPNANKMMVGIWFASGQNANNKVFKPMVVEGSEASAFEPYANICQINGYNMVNVGSTGKNIIAGSFYNTNVGSHGLDAGGNQFSTLYAKIRKNNEYVIVTADNNAVYGFIGEPQISNTSSFCDEYNDRFVTSVIVASDGRKYNVIKALITGWIVWRTTLNTVSDCCIYEGTELLNDPLESNIVSVNLVSSVGSTVYGGTLTINEDGSGKMIVNRGMATYNGSEDNWQIIAGSDRFYRNVLPSNVLIPSGEYNDHYKSNQAVYRNSPGSFIYGAYWCFGSQGVYINKLRSSETVEELKTRLTATPIQISYLLATPTTYTLTTTQLQTLVGTNHIWTDGTQIELDYHKEKYAEQNQLLAAFPKVTAGPADVVTITNGADNIPVENLTVAIEPKQNLHGYDHPWVGGTRKNLLDLTPVTSAKTDAGITATPMGDGRFTLSGAATTNTCNIWFLGSYGSSASTIMTLPAGTYTVFDCVLFKGTAGVAGASTYSSFHSAIKISSTSPIEISGIRICNVTNGSDYSGTILRPMIVEGDYTNGIFPSWEPYENICPIMGFNRVKIRRIGENLFSKSNVALNKNWINGDASGRAVVFFTIKSGVKYHYYLKYNGSRNIGVVYGENSAIGQSQTYSWNSGMSISTLNEHTTTNTQAFIQFQWNEYGKSDSLLWSDIDDWEIIISESEINMQDAIVTMPDEAEAVYSGTLDVTTGKLVMDGYKLDLGSLTWNYEEEYNRFYCNNLPINIIHGKHSGNSRDSYCISDSYECKCNSEPYNNNWNAVLYFGNYQRIYIHDHRYSTADALKAAVTGKYVVYPIDPITYQLTPLEVSTILGNNNFSCDAGQVTVTYRADPSLLINKLVSAMNAYGITV